MPIAELCRVKCRVAEFYDADCRVKCRRARMPRNRVYGQKMLKFNIPYPVSDYRKKQGLKAGSKF